MTVYLDRVFLINSAIDYLLLVLGGHICAIPPKRLKYGVVAAGGGGYAALQYLPALHFLSDKPLLWSAGILMGLIAYGSKWRPVMVFYALSASLAGTLYAINRHWPTDFRSGKLIWCAVIFFLIYMFLIRGKRCHWPMLLPVSITVLGRSVGITALHDTGNDLRDPTGKPVLIVSQKTARLIFPGISAADPYAWLCEQYPSREVLLLSFQTISGDGLLPAIPCDEIMIGKRRYQKTYIAIADASFSGAYQALWGGEGATENDIIQILTRFYQELAAGGRSLHRGQ